MRLENMLSLVAGLLTAGTAAAQETNEQQDQGGREGAVALPTHCAESLRDSTAAGCLPAASGGQLGALYPLSLDFHVTPAGRVGMGVATPATKLHLHNGNAVIGNGGFELFDSGTPTLGMSAHELQLWNGLNQGTLSLDSNFGLTSGQLLLRNANDVSTVSLASSAFPTNAASFVLVNANGNTTVHSAAAGFGGEMFFRKDDGRETVALTGGFDGLFEAGHLTLRNDAGEDSAVVDGGAHDGGGRLLLYGGDTVDTVALKGEGEHAGGTISLGNGASEEAVTLNGDRGFAESGELTLFDRISGHESAALHGGIQSGGARLRLGPPVGSSAITLSGLGSTTGRISLRGSSGGVALDLGFDSLRLYDDSGASTVSYNRLTGAKNAVVDTPNHGRRLLYKTEAPGVWFEDLGSGRLENGVAHVRLDPIFLETVTIDERHPLLVFTTVTGDGPDVFVEKHRDGFTVCELGGGRGEHSFDWRVAAKRRGLENERLEPFADPGGESDGSSTAASSQEPEVASR